MAGPCGLEPRRRTRGRRGPPHGEVSNIRGPFAKMMTRRIVCREVVLLLRRTGSLLQDGARGLLALGRLLGRLAARGRASR